MDEEPLKMEEIVPTIERVKNTIVSMEQHLQTVQKELLEKEAALKDKKAEKKAEDEEVLDDETVVSEDEVKAVTGADAVTEEAPHLEDEVIEDAAEKMAEEVIELKKTSARKSTSKKSEE